MKRIDWPSTKTRFRTRTPERVLWTCESKGRGKELMDTSDLAKRLAEKLIEQLKDGVAPWQQPWAAGQALGPYNPTTGNRYRGVNILALMATDYTDPRWMTYKQAQGQGGRWQRWQTGTGQRRKSN